MVRVRRKGAKRNACAERSILIELINNFKHKSPAIKNKLHCHLTSLIASNCSEPGYSEYSDLEIIHTGAGQSI